MRRNIISSLNLFFVLSIAYMIVSIMTIIASDSEENKHIFFILRNLAVCVFLLVTILLMLIVFYFRFGKNARGIFGGTNYNALPSAPGSSNNALSSSRISAMLAHEFAESAKNWSMASKANNANALMAFAVVTTFFTIGCGMFTFGMLRIEPEFDNNITRIDSKIKARESEAKDNYQKLIERTILGLSTIESNAIARLEKTTNLAGHNLEDLLKKIEENPENPKSKDSENQLNYTKTIIAQAIAAKEFEHWEAARRFWEIVYKISPQIKAQNDELKNRIKRNYSYALLKYAIEIYESNKKNCEENPDQCGEIREAAKSDLTSSKVAGNESKYHSEATKGYENAIKLICKQSSNPESCATEEKVKVDEEIARAESDPSGLPAASLSEK